MDLISLLESPDQHSCLKESFMPRSPWVLLSSELECQGLLVTCSEMSACPRRPLPSSSPHGWSSMHMVVHFSCPVSVLLCYSALCKALSVGHSALCKAATVEPGNMDTRLVAYMVISPWLLGTLTGQRIASWSGLSAASHSSSLHTPASQESVLRKIQH